MKLNRNQFYLINMKIQIRNYNLKFKCKRTPFIIPVSKTLLNKDNLSWKILCSEVDSVSFLTTKYPLKWSTWTTTEISSLWEATKSSTSRSTLWEWNQTLLTSRLRLIQMEILSFPVFSKQIKPCSKLWEKTRSSISISKNSRRFSSSLWTKFKKQKEKWAQACWFTRMENASWLCGTHPSSKTFKSSVWTSINKTNLT